MNTTNKTLGQIAHEALGTTWMVQPMDWDKLPQWKRDECELMAKAVVASLPEAAPAGSAVADKGPWKVDNWSDDRVVLQSDDFKHDVALIVTGDFADIAQRKAYAETLCKSMNTAQPSEATSAPMAVEAMAWRHDDHEWRKDDEDGTWGLHYLPADGDDSAPLRWASEMETAMLDAIIAKPTASHAAPAVAAKGAVQEQAKALNLTLNEWEFVYMYLSSDHDGQAFVPRCPHCTARKKIKAFLAGIAQPKPGAGGKDAG